MSTPRILLDNAADKLPSPDGIALAIMELWQDENTTVDQLTQLVQADPALSGRLLKLANSASLGSRPVSSINGAIVKVGMKTVGQLAVAFSLIDKEVDGQCEAFDYQQFWSQSLCMALVCRGLGRLCNLAPPDELFSCALMSRIGLLALATIYPHELSELIESTPRDLAGAERGRFGFDHNEVSAEMLADFGVPPVLAEPARFHERPEQSGYAPRSRPAQLTHLFGLAFRLSDSMVRAGLEQTEKSIETLPGPRRLGLSTEQVSEVLQQSISEWQEWSHLLDLPSPSLQPGAETEADTAATTAGPDADDEDAHLRVLLIGQWGREHRLKALLEEARGVAAQCYSDQKEMLRAALLMRPQLIILAEHEDRETGNKLCRLIRSTEWGRLVYIMAIVDKSDCDQMAQVFRAGVDACIQSQIGLPELDARMVAVRRMIALQNTWQKDRAELRQIANELALSQRRMEVLSLTDQLTGLPNRRAALAAMKQAWSMSCRSELPMSVIMIDIDHFKRVNDTFGHPVGDRVLMEVAKALRAEVRESEGIYRMGGEEFLLLSSTGGIKQLVIAAERLRRRIAALRIEVEQDLLQVTISLGLAEREPEHERFDAMLVAADKALYAAKAYGRNCIFYHRRQQVHHLKVPRQP
ncbi:MAG: diguanylate cyclase [Gammaproteobacteria bacterium]|nr:diguanylate cyclase [Gammaproteobacteria bacterium]